MGTIAASDNEFPKVIFVEGAAPGTPPAGFVYVYAKADGRMYGKDDTGTEFAMNGATAEASIAAHLADTSDAHDASAISVLDSGAHFTATDVEAALAELFAAIGAGGISPTIVAAKGDILGASANDTPAITSVGTNFQRLVADSSQSTGLAWQGFVGVKAYHNTTETATDPVLSMNSEEFDTNGFHDTGANTSRLTVPTGYGGKYAVHGGTFSSGSSRLEVLVNGTAIRGGIQTLAAAGYMQAHAVLSLAAADYVEIKANAGASRTYGSASTNKDQTHLAMWLVGV